MSGPDMGRAARQLAERGFPVVPLHEPRSGNGCTCLMDLACKSPAKHPRTLHGLLDATANLEKIKTWWGKWPTSNIAIVTGASSGVWALDVDPKHGGPDALARLEGEYGSLPETVRVRTGSGGFHVWLAWPADIEVRNSAGRLGPGLDVRGEGGFLVAPPSLHVSGRRYEWAGGKQIASAPNWLLALAAVPPESGGPKTDWAAFVRNPICEGQRNSEMTRLAGVLVRKLDPHLALELLLSFNATRCVPPLPDREVVTIAESIAARELRRRARENAA